MSIKKIGVFTSGGDSPGMNAAIRSAIRSTIYFGYEAAGIRRGYQGMIEGDINDMNGRSVANIIQRGGTILKSARSDEFRTAEGRKKAYENLKENNIDALIAIGGDGTFRGAKVFGEEFDFPIIGIPGTIDNDLIGTDFTLGYDTAVNTAVEAIDKIRDTAMAHDRLFIIEVMGRDAGLIALRSGIAGGAESILIPELKSDIEDMYATLKKGAAKGKLFSIVVVAEGDDAGGAFKVKELIESKFDQFDVKVTILGHIQRGGNPTCSDRVLASRLGLAAVEALDAGERGAMVGIVHSDVKLTPFEKAAKHKMEVDSQLARLATILS